MNLYKIGLLLLILTILLPTYSCNAEQNYPNCGELSSFYYANTSSELIDKMRTDAWKEEKNETQVERRLYLRNLNEIPFPSNVPFTYTSIDYGDGAHTVELYIQPHRRDHVTITCCYPRITYSYTYPDSGEKVDYIGSIEYTFYRVYIYHHQILQSVEDFYNIYYSKNFPDSRAEIINGDLYIQQKDVTLLYFDLNPGIGVVRFFNDTENSIAIPYEVLLPLCQWELIPVNPWERESVTDHVGWW